MPSYRLAAPLAAALLAIALTPATSLACACGCGVFGVGTASMFPSGSGGTAFVEYDFMSQDRNWSGSHSAPAADNSDKLIRTSFYTVGAQYMVSRKWGVIAELPYWDRTFKTDGGSGVDTFHHTGLGDVRIEGLYTGFSPDMSTGVTFGVKLPTGVWRQTGLDRDTQIGTGSTDLLVGAYHLGSLDKAGKWTWFAQAKHQHAVATQAGYRPGDELNATAGVAYTGFNTGPVKITPVARVIASSRAHDTGPNANPDNSGYQRVLVAPGLEAEMKGVRLYGDVEFPAWQHVRGNQLVAPVLFKVVLSHEF